MDYREKFQEAEQYIAQLEEKIKEAEAFVGKVLAEDKMVLKVVGGPAEHDGQLFYRVNGGGGEKLCTYDTNRIFDDTPIEMGCEVVVVKSHIISVIPKELVAAVKDMPKFKHISFEEIGGLKSQLTTLREAIETPLQNREIATEYGVDLVKGVMLYGPPGCGKTLIAKAVASMILDGHEATEDAFIYIKGPELLDMYVGNTEKSIRGVFSKGREYAKANGHRAILCIDEADAVVPTRGSRRSSDVELTSVPAMLSEMDGFDEFSPMVLLITNLPNSIDPAILREGRIDLKLKITAPNAEDTEEIFGIHLRKVKKLSDSPADLAEYATKELYRTSAGEYVTGAMIQAIVQSANRKALNRRVSKLGGKDGIMQNDLYAAIHDLKYKSAKDEVPA